MVHTMHNQNIQNVPIEILRLARDEKRKIQI